MSTENLVNINDPTVTLSVTSTSSNVALSRQSGILLIQNAGTKTCFVTTGIGSGTVATTSSLPILANGSFTVRNYNLNTYVAAICGGTDTTTLYVTSTEGVKES